MAVTSSRAFKVPAQSSSASSPATTRAESPAAASPAQIAVADGARVATGHEVRCLMAGLQLRSGRKGQAGPGTVVGYAAVFESFSQDLGGFYETIQRGAFAQVLSQDVRALKNHDSNYLLGRAKPGTLRLEEDELGLRTEIDLPDTQIGRDTAIEIDRGDMDGMSFSFVLNEDGDEWKKVGDRIIRTILANGVRDLYDVGPVAFPAYTDTSAAMRSMERRGLLFVPSSPARPAFDPLEVIKFRLQVEQLRVLPLPPE